MTRRATPDYAALGRAFHARQVAAARAGAAKPVTEAQRQARQRNAAVAREKKYRQSLATLKAGRSVEQ